MGKNAKSTWLSLFYARILAQFGVVWLAGKGQQLLDMTRQGNWQKMPSIITDEMLSKFVPCGTYGEIAQIFHSRFGGLAHRITFPMPENPIDDEVCGVAVRQLQESITA